VSPPAAVDSLAVFKFGPDVQEEPLYCSNATDALSTEKGGVVPQAKNAAV